MSKIKANEDFTGYKPLELAVQLNNTGEGVGTDPDFSDSPYSSTILKAMATKIIASAEAAEGGTKLQQIELAEAATEGWDIMSQMGKYANFKYNGSSTMFAKLKIPFYDASLNKGSKSSEFSLTQGPDSGELWITVPVRSDREAYIAMYSLIDTAPLEDWHLAGASTHCAFLLRNLPTTTRLYVRWARITGQGITEWSEPYPITVS